LPITFGSPAKRFCQYERRLHTQRGKIVAGHPTQNAVVPFLIRSYPHERRAFRNNVAEGIRLLPDIEIVGVGKALEALRTFLLHGQYGNLVGLWHRQRTQQESVNDAENGGVDRHPQT
jgi:hypothetical protein